MTAELDWDKVDELLIAGCIGTEIAGYFGIHPNTLYRKVEEEKKVSFGVYLQEKRSKGDSLLRAHQYKKAIGLTDKGDNTLLIWLGKNRLKQRDVEKVEQQESFAEMAKKLDQLASEFSVDPNLKNVEIQINSET